MNRVSACSSVIAWDRNIATIDRGGGKLRERHRRERVTAHRARQHDFGSRATRGERLVGSLAARMNGESRTGEGLAGTGQSRDARDQVEIDRAEDDDHGGAGARNQGAGG